MSKELYDWQEECLDKWFANNCRGMVQAVTGSGKTLLALTAVSRLEQQLGQQLRVKIVVPTSTLMRQWNRTLLEFLSRSHKERISALELRKEIGMRGGGARPGPIRHYMIYVINSARYELARQILTELKRGEMVFLIADECHHYGSAQNQLIFEFLPYIKQWENHFFSLGLSATLPTGQAQRYLSSVLGRKIYHYGIAEASMKRTICPCDIYHISLTFRADERETYEELSARMSILYKKLLKASPSLSSLGQKELFEQLRSLSANSNSRIAEMAVLYMNLSYKRKNLVCLASSRTSCTRDLVQHLNATDKILIFSEHIEQADELYRLLNTCYPEQAGRYHSKMGEQANRNVLERFQNSSIRILIACKAIDEGIDIPDVSVGIIMSGTSTQRQRIQRLGRILRKNDGKISASLYYLHIIDSSEDSCFLPDSKGRHLFDLTYNPQMQSFYNPAYDASADLFLKKLQETDLSSDKLDEAQRCLRLGCVRSDWLLEPDYMDAQIKKSRYTSEKNYWICMKGIRLSQCEE